MDRSIVTVDRNDRTVTKFRPIKGCVLHVLKHPSLRFNLIDCQDTSLSFLSIPSCSSSISALTEPLRLRFGEVSSEKSALEARHRVLDVLRDYSR